MRKKKQKAKINVLKTESRGSVKSGITELTATLFEISLLLVELSALWCLDKCLFLISPTPNNREQTHKIPLYTHKSQVTTTEKQLASTCEKVRYKQ